MEREDIALLLECKNALSRPSHTTVIDMKIDPIRPTDKGIPPRLPDSTCRCVEYIRKGTRRLRTEPLREHGPKPVSHADYRLALHTGYEEGRPSHLHVDGERGKLDGVEYPEGARWRYNRRS